MTISFEVADRIFQAPKSLLKPIKWRVAESKKGNEQFRRLECRVAVDGGVPRGVFFRIAVFPRSLAWAMFQLECDLPSGRKHVPLYRLEVEPLSAHGNKLYGPDEINGAIFDAGETHEHVFYDSLKKDGTLRPNACEQARKVNVEIRDFATGLRYACDRINIVNPDEVPPPADQGTLL